MDNSAKIFKRCVLIAMICSSAHAQTMNPPSVNQTTKIAHNIGRKALGPHAVNDTLDQLKLYGTPKKPTKISNGASEKVQSEVLEATTVEIIGEKIILK